MNFQQLEKLFFIFLSGTSLYVFIYTLVGIFKKDNSINSISNKIISLILSAIVLGVSLYFLLKLI